MANNNIGPSTAQTILSSTSSPSFHTIQAPLQSERLESPLSNPPLPRTSSTHNINNLSSLNVKSFLVDPPEYSDLNHSTPSIVDSAHHRTLESLNPQFLPQQQEQLPRPQQQELPIYIPISESNIPFILLRGQSTTYTVIPSRGLSEFPSLSTLREPYSNSNDIEPNPSPNNNQQESPGVDNQQSTHTWTLEYWNNNDTISFLCYLMDPIFPKKSTASHGHINRGSATDSSVIELENLPPIDHIRGRPPPLNRAALAIPRGFRPIRGQEAAQAVTSHRTQESQTSNVASTDPQIPLRSNSITDNTTTSVVEDQAQPQNSTSTTAAPSTSTQEEQTIFPSLQQGPFGSLPSTQHIRINDGYAGEEEDAILAHAIDIRGVQDTAVNMIYDGTFNNALYPEFFKSPSFALVSAEDPQTWLWWSKYHATKLQESKQESSREVVTMWWRTRLDVDTSENKRLRKKFINAAKERNKLANEVGPKHKRRIFGHKIQIPRSYYAEVFMRVRSVGYSWREEHNVHDEEAEVRSGDSSLKSMSRVFSLYKERTNLSDEPHKETVVAQVWIEGKVSSCSSTDVTTGQHHQGASSSFPVGLRERRCIIRVANGIHPHVMTFALSTGPRLIEIFDDTEEIVPGPSNASVKCVLVLFAAITSAIFIAIIYVRTPRG